MLDFVSTHIDNLLAAVIAGFGSWFFTRKKLNAETKIVEGDALVNMQKGYNLLVEDMNNKFSQMKTEIQQVHSENAELKAEIGKVHDENVSLKKGLDSLRRENTKLKSQIDKIKKGE